MKIMNALIISSAFALLIACGGSGAGSSSGDASSLVNPASSNQSSSSSLAASSLSSSSASLAAVSSSAASSESLAAVCDFPAKFSWESTEPLITPKAANHVSIKDPTIVYYNNLYHVFATVFDTSRNAWSAVYLNFSDFSQADSAPQISLANKPAGDTVAPQVFYFRPHNKWYLISQWGAKYSTNTDISNPDTWTAPKSLLANGPSVGLDYWVICDEAYCHLFFAGDDGNLYRSKTTIDNFPNFSGYDIVMSDEVAKVFEAPNVYKVKGKNQYLLLVEAMDPRYFRSWTATSLDGPWVPLADQQSAPFAGPVNVSYPGKIWSNGISHGEMIRSGYDQKLEINPCNMQFLYQGFDPATVAPNTDYSRLPYRLGLIKAK